MESIRIFFQGSDIHFRDLVNQGALILDVRSQSEFSLGHIPGSVNIPLEDLAEHLHTLQTGKTVIACCTSGMKSASATRLLASLGFKAVNGGSWKSLMKELQED